jgi:hypothetical protein
LHFKGFVIKELILTTFLSCMQLVLSRQRTLYIPVYYLCLYPGMLFVLFVFLLKCVYFQFLVRVVYLFILHMSTFAFTKEHANFVNLYFAFCAVCYILQGTLSTAAVVRR